MLYGERHGKKQVSLAFGQELNLDVQSPRWV